MYVKLSWRPEVDENWAIMVVQPPILTYTTMVFYFWLPPQVLWNDLRGIVIKQRHWQTFWGIIHVCQAILETGSGRTLSHNASTAANFDLHDHGFLLLTCSTGPMEWSTSSNKTIYQCFHPLPVPMATRITKYLNKYVRRDICLIYMSSFYFWIPPLARKMQKNNMRYYPEYPSRSWHPILAP
jgi:hypothetical protein